MIAIQSAASCDSICAYFGVAFTDMARQTCTNFVNTNNTNIK